MTDLRPPPFDTNDSIRLRGDRIDGQRYHAREFMAREWEKLWPRIWHIAGRVADVPQAGDWLMHEIGRQSIVVVRQADGSIKAFHNVCMHRGNRLVHGDVGSSPSLTCSYHGWRFSLDGKLEHAQDVHDFPLGDPRASRNLREVRCDVWGGFVWINMDADAPELMTWLDPLPELCAGYGMDDQIRVLYLTVDVDCNWKIIQDNFNESYHLPTIHPELATFIDDALEETAFEIYPSGHNRMRMKGGRATLRQPDLVDPTQPLDAILAQWGIDAADYRGRGAETRTALQKARRSDYAEKGYHHYATLDDEQLTDYHHYNVFPNVSLTMSSDGFQLLRVQPHPTDPEKCVFDHWYMVPTTPDTPLADTPLGPKPRSEAAQERFGYGEQSAGAVADQDLSIAVGQQLGVQSFGFDDFYLAGQEHRVRRFHELINDFLEGRR